jgi:hypothetical protein
MVSVMPPAPTNVNFTISPLPRGCATAIHPPQL